MSLDASESDSLFHVNPSMAEIDDITLSRSLSFALSIESIESMLDVEPEGYVPAIFNEWIRRVGKLPYSRELNYFVYDYLPEFDSNALIEILGEEVVEKLLVIPFSDNDGDLESLIDALKAFTKEIGGKDDGEERLLKVLSDLEKKSGSKKMAVASVFAHLLNKSINNMFVAMRAEQLEA